ncbi:MAG: hypothetical protein FD129_1957, partial [bacterium]
MNEAGSQAIDGAGQFKGPEQPGPTPPANRFDIGIGQATSQAVQHAAIREEDDWTPVSSVQPGAEAEDIALRAAFVPGIRNDGKRNHR